jgi:DNA-binding response OmpR family regulator
MRGKILVVIEDANIRSVVESLLKEQGIDVFSFNTTHKGLDWLLLAKPDLIILDDSLPEPPIAVVCKKIRMEQKLTNVPLIVLLNSLEAVRKTEELKKAGASDFVVQPFNPRELLEKVEIYLLEKAATSKDVASAGINHSTKSADKLGELFASEEALDIDSILSEGKKPTESDDLEELLKPADDQISIETTPWGMDLTPEPEVQPSETQHDYNWFLDEMHREAQGEKSGSKPPARTESKSEPELRPVKKTPEQIKVEELGTSKLDYQKLAAQIKNVEITKKDTPQEPEFNPQIVIEEENTFRKKDQPKSPSPKTETAKLMPGEEKDYNRLYEDLTEKLAERLAKELASRLKPETIIQLLKEELEKAKG